VRGFVRLSVKKPLAFDAAQQSGGALRVVIAERFAVIEFEVGFGEVAMQVSLADVVELPVNRPFEEHEEPLDGVGMVETASPHILIRRMVDGAMTGKLAA
jgi:hypothetical protein